MWDWWDDTVDAVSEWVGDAWDTANDWVDEYIWDTSEDEAVVEEFVRETFDVPDEEGKGFIGEVNDKVNDLIDTYIWNTSEDEAAVEEWVKDTVEDVDNTVRDALDDARTTVGGVIRNVIEYIENIVYNITLALGAGWEAFLDALTSLPEKFDLVFGKPWESSLDTVAKLPDTLSSLNNIDLSLFVEDGMKLYEVQRQLMLKVAEAEQKRTA